MSDRRTNLTNAELAAVYQALRGDMTHSEMAEVLDKTRTNSYYYVGRAVAYWVKTGVLRFRRGTTIKDLGGIDIPKNK